jgi:hypothetical protein
MARQFSATSRAAPTIQPERVGKTTFPVEVMEVMLSESHPEYKGDMALGAIRGRRYDTEKGVSVEDLPWYNPIDPTDLKIPLIGEAVLLVEAPEAGILHSKVSRALYYTSTIGLFGSISNNAVPGLAAPLEYNSLISFTGNMGPQEESGIGDYAPQTFIPPLIVFEGDRIIQGRWGNAIRFSNTSNGSDDQTFWNNSTGDGDPITIISNGVDDQTGLTRTEDLNDGSSNLILSSTQQIEIEASNKLPMGYQKLNQYAGSQIVLSSDKIILNSMEDNVVISGKKGVSISTPEWKADISDLCDILLTVVEEFHAFSTATKPAVTGVGPTGPTPSAGKMTEILTKIKTLQQ